MPQLLLLLFFVVVVAPAADSDGGSSTPQHCAAGNFGALANCTRAASLSSATSGQWTIAVRGSIDCPAHGCDTLVPGHGGQQISLQNTSSPVLLYGAGPAGTGVHSTRAVIRRGNFTAPLLTIGYHRAPVRITGISFEDPQRGDCWAWDRCDVVKYGSCESQVVLMDAEASVHFENCAFVRGYDIGVALNGAHGATFTKNLWLEHQITGMWSCADVSVGVRLLNNEWRDGQNPAIMGNFDNGTIQGNVFRHNHHVSCCNSSGGQVALGGSAPFHRAEDNMTWVRSNLIEDAAINDGSPALYPAVPGKPRYPPAHGFELNDGLSLAIYHNDVRNNSGWSIIANRSPSDFNTTCPNSFCPGFSYPVNSTVSFGDNRLCSDIESTAGIPTVCGNPYVCNVSTGPWLHPAPGNCHGGAACGCSRPLRPRGQISAAHCSGVSGCTMEVRWFVLDFAAATPLRVVVHDSAASPGAAPVKVRADATDFPLSHA